jgi:hypothetical protein
LTNPFDHDRDGVVNFLDVAVVRGNLFAVLPAPVTGVSAASVPATTPRDRTARYRPAVWAGLQQ